MKSYKQGSTFCGILINCSQLAYYTINIGDSKVVKVVMGDSSNNSIRAQPLTEDHKVSNAKERKRIESIHTLVRNRLGGCLLVTRALGDFSYAKYGLCSQPDVSRHDLTSERLLLIGSDGVWDVIDNSGLESLLALSMTQNSEDIAKLIVQKAVLKSLDNISLIVISFPQSGKVQVKQEISRDLTELHAFVTS